jgi:hypothetical protein
MPEKFRGSGLYAVTRPRTQVEPAKVSTPDRGRREVEVRARILTIR